MVNNIINQEIVDTLSCGNVVLTQGLMPVADTSKSELFITLSVEVGDITHLLLYPFRFRPEDQYDHEQYESYVDNILGVIDKHWRMIKYKIDKQGEEIIDKISSGVQMFIEQFGVAYVDLPVKSIEPTAGDWIPVDDEDELDELNELDIISD